MSTRAEQLDESRRQIEESSAISVLNLIWGMKLFVNIIILIAFTVIVFSVGADASFGQAAAVFIFCFFLLLESFCIVSYYRRKRWSLVALSFFAAPSLLNIPIGTILAAVHYINVGKVRFSDKSG